MRVILGFAIGIGALFALTTLVALEGTEVVILHTAGADGARHRTRAWIADEPEGTALIEAANPERPFLRDLAATGTLGLERHGVRHACRTTPLPDPDGHDRIRRLLAARYGWADRWIGLLTNTHASRAVRLHCE